MYMIRSYFFSRSPLRVGSRSRAAYAQCADRAVSSATMRVSRKDLESLVRVQISALCSFLAIPRYSASQKKDQQLVLVHDWLLQHPGALPVKAWLWVKEGRAGTPKPAHFSPEELADTVQYVLEENVCADETMEEMDDGSTLVDPRSKTGQAKTPPRMSEGGLSQEGDSHPSRSQSAFPGGASGGATLMSTQGEDDDGFPKSVPKNEDQ